MSLDATDTGFGLFWKIIGTDPFDVGFPLEWAIEFGEPPPDAFLVASAARVAIRIRVATTTGRYP